MMGELSVNSQRDARIAPLHSIFLWRADFSLCLNVLKSVKAVSVAAFIWFPFPSSSTDRKIHSLQDYNSQLWR